LMAALTRANLKQAFKRVRANKGAAGVDGLDIDQTSRHLVTAWSAIREQLLKGTYRPREQGTPQGGPLSPLLANVLLDEVDKELERRGHCFVRYADDANV
ncbi:reverse transcriptase domain-containing protein, partial [Paraburkholderia youngii]|uniref:reverse transcriptase domain-containing protein n=1 Tax=Paraburkholderia youngii TaxID=2782701 RepID=UPI001E127897